MGSRKLGWGTRASEATGAGPNEDGSSARKAATSQAAASGSGNCVLPGSLDLCDKCPIKVTKECLGWEEVQVLDWQALQTLVALAWVTAGFLYHMGVTFEWEEVQLIAKLGGWEPHKDRQPGKITLMRGLRRLIDLLATQAILTQFVTQHEALPPNLAAFLQGWTPPNEL